MAYTRRLSPLVAVEGLKRVLQMEAQPRGMRHPFVGGAFFNPPTVMEAARQHVAAAALQVEAPAHQVQDQLEVPTRKAAQAGAEVAELSPRLATVVDLEEEAEADGSEAAAAIMLLEVAAHPLLQIC